MLITINCNYTYHIVGFLNIKIFTNWPFPDLRGKIFTNCPCSDLRENARDTSRFNYITRFMEWRNFHEAESVVQRYHIYKEIWSAAVGTTLSCRQESFNPYESYGLKTRQWILN